MKQRDQLEQWTSLRCSQIVFDSFNDNWSHETSVFDERIIGKSKLVFLIEDEEGEIFGYYLNTEVKNEYKKVFKQIINHSILIYIQISTD